MLVTTAVCSFLLGVFATLVVLYVIVSKYVRQVPRQSIPFKTQFPQYKLPKSLANLLKDPSQLAEKQNCVFLNLIFHFLFRELKDSKRIRQWMVKKMNVEFAELLQTTTGRLIDQISVREFSLGSTFPVFNSVAVRNATLQNEEDLEELDLALDIDYAGGFQLAVDMDLVVGKWAYLCITITNLKGIARFQLTRQPYTHWSFSFYEEPQLDLSVESRYGGKALPQITSLVINQIRRSLKKKHVLPNFKMRFRPFFDKYEEPKQVREMCLFGNWIGEGRLKVTVIGCSRLNIPAALEGVESKLYCTLSVDSMRWTDLINLKKKLWVSHDIDVVLPPNTPVGLSLKDDFLLDKYEDVVVVDKVDAGSPAAVSLIKKGDVIISVGTTRVTSLKQAKKLFKNAGEKFSVRIERSKSKGQQQFQENIQVLEDSVTASDEMDKDCKYTGEDFVNISLKTVETDPRTGQILRENVPQKQRVMSLVNSGKAFVQRKVRGHTVGEMQQASPTDIPANKKLKQTQSASSSPRKDGDFRTVRQRAHSDTSLIKVDDAELEEEVGSDEEQSDTEERLCETQRTDEISLPQKNNIIKWDEKFTFCIEKEDRFLNICVWCKIPEKLDKQNKVLKPGKELLMGHVSLSLSDVCLDCLMTTQGDTQHTIPLVNPETRAGARNPKISNYASHKGFEPDLCNGDITLGFLHSPLRMSEEDKKKMTKIKRNSTTESQQEIIPTEEVKAPNITETENKSEEGRHDFAAAIFNTATYCDFCGKKIWFREAVQCGICSMICHKKCNERCQTQTWCTPEGAKCRDKPSEPWKPPITQAEAEKRKAKESTRKTGGILSKFRKDSSLERKQAPPPISPRHSPSPDRLQVPAPSPHVSPQGSPQSSPQLSRRRNSAPGKEFTKGRNDSADPTLPHTHSTTSLQGLINTKLTAGDAFAKSKHGDGDSSDDSEGDLPPDLQEHVSKMNRSTGNLDEMVVTAAKEMGKELFAELSLEERKDKLDNMVMKLQQEIDKESENKTCLLKSLENESLDPASKDLLQKSLAKSDEKVEAMMMMMLHYCAGLQYCLDQEGEEKRKPKEEPVMEDKPNTHMADSSESEKEASMSEQQGAEVQHVLDKGDSTSLESSASDSQEKQSQEGADSLALKGRSESVSKLEEQNTDVSDVKSEGVIIIEPDDEADNTLVMFENSVDPGILDASEGII